MTRNEFESKCIAKYNEVAQEIDALKLEKENYQRIIKDIDEKIDSASKLVSGQLVDVLVEYAAESDVTLLVASKVSANYGSYSDSTKSYILSAVDYFKEDYQGRVVIMFGSMYKGMQFYNPCFAVMDDKFDINSSVNKSDVYNHCEEIIINMWKNISYVDDRDKVFGFINGGNIYDAIKVYCTKVNAKEVRSCSLPV